MRINPFDKNGNVICFCQTVYGPDAPQQFQYLGYKYNLAFDDVLQIAALTYLEKIDDYKPNIGTLPAFLFGHLIWAIRRYIDPVLKYAISIDDDRCLKEQIEQIAAAQPDEAIRFDANELKNPELQKMHAETQLISGKFTPEIASDWKKSVRRVNQIIEKKIQRAIDINYPI